MEKLRILIADNDSKARATLTETLETLGHTVIAEADSGVKAVEAARAHKPEMIILEADLPELDGIETARQIMAERNCALIFLTSSMEESIVDRAAEVGSLAFVAKPFRAEELGATLQIAAQRYRQIQSLTAEVETLKDNLETRKLIDRAKGILMTRAGLTEDDAYKRIHHQARNQNKKMRDIAQSIITASELM